MRSAIAQRSRSDADKPCPSCPSTQAQGRGSEADLDTLSDLAELLQNCKCTLCPSSAEAVRHAVTHFRDDFLAYITAGAFPRVRRADDAAD